MHFAIVLQKSLLYLPVEDEDRSHLCLFSMMFILLSSLLMQWSITNIQSTSTLAPLNHHLCIGTTHTQKRNNERNFFFYITFLV